MQKETIIPSLATSNIDVQCVVYLSQEKNAVFNSSKSTLESMTKNQLLPEEIKTHSITNSNIPAQEGESSILPKDTLQNTLPQLLSPATTLSAFSSRYIALPHFHLHNKTGDDAKCCYSAAFHQPGECLVNRAREREGRVAKVRENSPRTWAGQDIGMCALRMARGMEVVKGMWMI
jgi:hypothetical protein